MPKPVKVLIIWNRTGKTHFLLHLEVGRVMFLSHNEICCPGSSRRPQPSCALGGLPPSLDGVSSIQGEDDNLSVVGYREALRHRVYTIRRELPEVPMSSPSRKVLAPSDFMSCSGLVKDKPKGYKFFPESGHTKSALYFMNESISDFHSSKGTGNKYIEWFWSCHFPLFKD